MVKFELVIPAKAGLLKTNVWSSSDFAFRGAKTLDDQTFVFNNPAFAGMTSNNEQKLSTHTFNLRLTGSVNTLSGRKAITPSTNNFLFTFDI